MAIYTNENNKITISKYGFDTLKEYAIIYGILALVIYFFMVAIPYNYRVAMCVTLLVGVPVAFYFLKNIFIVFDNGEQVVFIKYPLIGKQVLVRYDEIDQVDFVTVTGGFMGLNTNNGYYRIAKKTDPMGKGIKILTNAPAGHNDTVDFNLHVLPLLNDYTTGGNNNTFIVDNLEATDYLKEKEAGVFVLRNFRWLPNLLWMGLLGIGIMMTGDYIKNGFKEWVDYAVIVVAVIMPVFAVYWNLKTITIDRNNFTVVTECPFGLFRKERNLHTFTGFHYERNSHNGIYVGTDLNMDFSEGGRLPITQYYSSTKLDKVVKEMSLILQGKK